jgi:hypothetical protein
MFENHNAVMARYTLLIAGIQKHITTAVVLANTTYATATDLAQPFQAWLGAAAATASAGAAYHAAVLNEEALYKVAQTVWLLLQAYARAKFGGDTATLADFGYAPVKHTPATPAVKAAAATKAAATRAARHTMGKKAKLAITGSTAAAPESPASPPVVPAVVRS